MIKTQVKHDTAQKLFYLELRPAIGADVNREYTAQTRYGDGLTAQQALEAVIEAEDAIRAYLKLERSIRALTNEHTSPQEIMRLMHQSNEPPAAIRNCPKI